MKIDKLETHDRLLQYNKQGDYISEGCEDCIRNRPKEFGDRPFYIFAHCRTHDNGYTKRLVWAPRLTRPKAQTNSMLFKYYPKEDVVKIIWMIPDRALWMQYNKGFMTENKIIFDSIFDFQHDRKKLEEKDADDVSDEVADMIFREISINKKQEKMMESLYKSKPETSEVFSAFLE
jgi:hypothetical protein